MSSDFRDRLRRLGVHKGTAHLTPRGMPVPALPSQPMREAHVGPADALETATLEAMRTAFGTAHVRRAVYALDHVHGDRPLRGALAPPPSQMGRLVFGRSGDVDLRNALFLDTETTGLAGGAGTLAFLVGVGYFADEHFVVEQYFLKDPAHEAAMLTAIDRHVAAHEALVTFNGRSFDVPLLETRFTLSRIAPEFADKQHLDLLLPARSVWKNALPSCSLGSLEYHVLQVRRTQQDVAGFLIPQLYREYLHSGGDVLTDDMNRVMYHNLLDILSMVTLSARLCEAIFRPRDGREHFASGAFHERVGEPEQAERAYRSAAQAEDALEAPRADAARRLARLLKSQKRHGEAREHWQYLADRDDVDALIELAKLHEWRQVDFSQALACALRARAVCEDSWRCAEIDQRVERLRRKVSRESE
ncbi:MAG: ribonuclease H-like domain-containing protein [Chloroflexi bacterium]|nr:ribonuclease H-like domain-containing protein [Chloroflexota bacterium]